MELKDELGEDLIDGIMAVGVDEHLNTISESDYIKHLLPLALKVHSGESPPLGVWVHFCGSSQLGVKVVDSNGHLAFISPSLFQKVSIKINTDFSALHDAVEQAKSRGGDGSVEFTQYVNHETAVVSIPKDTGSTVLEWAKVFSRYGYKMVSTKTAAVVDPKAPTIDTPAKVSDDLGGSDEFV